MVASGRAERCMRWGNRPSKSTIRSRIYHLLGIQVKGYPRGKMRSGIFWDIWASTPPIAERWRLHFCLGGKEKSFTRLLYLNGLIGQLPNARNGFTNVIYMLTMTQTLNCALWELQQWKGDHDGPCNHKHCPSYRSASVWHSLLKYFIY